MTKFLKDLGKGFVRSAVNQVGRDGGRVISNRVYGDQHSTPIRGIRNHGVVEVEGKIISDDFSPEPWLSNPLWVYFVMPISLSLFFWILWPFTLWRGIELITRKNTPIKLPYKEAIHAKDRRHTGGTRIEGYTTNYHIIKVESPPEHLTRYRIKGILYLLLSMIMILSTIAIVMAVFE